MPTQYDVLRVFVAGPDDVAAERAALPHVVDTINRAWLHARGLHFEVVSWDTTTHPAVGTDPQDAINQQIGDRYDIFVGILWSRFGSRTPRAGSGTEEEFLDAYKRYRSSPTTLQIMIYFSDAPIVAAQHDLGQVQQVLDFRRDLPAKGVLYQAYKTVEEFKEFLTLHLSALANDWGNTWGPVSTPVPGAKPHEVPPAPPTTLSLSAADADHGFLDWVLQGRQSMDELVDVLRSMTDAQGELAQNIDKRTGQIQQVKGKDAQALQTMKYIADRTGEDLNSFVSKIDADVPRFAAAYATALNSYARATLMLPDFNENDIDTVVDTLSSIEDLTNSLRTSQAQIAEFRDTVAKLPPLTTPLTQAKNKTVAALRKLDDEWTRAIDLSEATQPPLLNMVPTDRKVILGSNAFFGVPFPLVLADRFFMVSGEPQSPRLTVFRWDPSSRRAFYQIVDNQIQPDALDSDPTGTLTFEHPEPTHFLCTFRARADVDEILGKVPIDALFEVTITDDSIHVTHGGSDLTLTKNQFEHSLVGVAIPADGSVSLGSNEIPPGMILDTRHASPQED